MVRCEVKEVMYGEPEQREPLSSVEGGRVTRSVC